MGSFLSQFFVPLNQLPAVRELPEQCLSEDFPPKEFSLGGLVQLAFLGMAYGMIVFRGSNLIADGSELLLLIPSIAPVVGSLVLPVLGAVPDGTIVLFSGMGPRDQVQKNLAVGVGALAGSTIMLLTVPWFLSILAGRVDLDERSRAQYRQRPQKLSNKKDFWTETGVEPDWQATRQAAQNMLVTLLPYFFIQGAAFAYQGDKTVEDKSKDEAGWALAGMVVCALFFAGYMYQHMRGAEHDKVIQDKTDAVREDAVKHGLISLRGAFFQVLKKYEQLGAPSGRLLGSSSETDGLARFRSTVSHFFRKYDTDGNGSIDKHELGFLLGDLQVAHDPEDGDRFLQEMDVDASGTISFDEFVDCMAATVTGKKDLTQSTRYGALDSNVQVLHQVHQGLRPLDTSRQSSYHSEGMEDEEEEEEEEVPEDLVNLPPDQQQRRILRRAFGQMFLGVALVLVFSDPLVEVFSELGEVCGVSAFYISFVLAPLASNASEILASYYYAKRKTSKTITISLCTLMGAAILNNTFVLGIFLSLIRFRELDWEFSAETIAIIVVELIVGAVSLTRRAHTMRWSGFVLSLFPLSLLLVAFLQSKYVGWD